MKVPSSIQSLVQSMISERSALPNWKRMTTLCSYLHHRIDDPYSESKPFSTANSAPARNADMFVNGLFAAVMPQNDVWARFTTGCAETINNTEEKRERTGSIKSNQRRKKEREELFNAGELRTLDEIEGALDYFEDSMQKIVNSFHESSFYPEMQKVGLDAFVMGYGVLKSVREGETREIVHESLNPWECYIRNSSNGRIAVFARVFRLSAFDAYMAYGSDCPESIVKQVGTYGDSAAIYEFAEIILKGGILKDDDGVFIEPKSNNHKYVHIVYLMPSRLTGTRSETGDNDVVQWDGFAEMPIEVLNFRRASYGAYGVSMLEKCYDNIIRLDQVSRMLQSAVDYSMDPAWAVSANMSKNFSAKRGAINVISSMNQGSDVPVPLQKNSAFNELYAIIQYMEQNLKEDMYIDIIKPVLQSGDSRKTATEINAKQSEAQQLLAQLLGNLELFISGVIKKTFNMMRMNSESVVKGNNGFISTDVMSHVIRKPNDEIARLLPVVRVMFDSPYINRIRSYYNQDGTIAFLNIYPILAQIDPSSRYNFDFDFISRSLASSCGMSQFSIREKSEVAELKEQEAQLAAQQMLANQQEQSAEANMKNSQAQYYASGGSRR